MLPGSDTGGGAARRRSSPPSRGGGRRVPSPPPRRSRPATSYRSSGRSFYRGGGGGGGGRPSRSIGHNVQSRASRPILPTPSADSIAELFDQVAGFNRDYRSLGVNATAQRGELGAARGLFLKQLLDAFGRSKTSALEDYSARGLADSGIANEGMAKMENEYNTQRGEYETGYTSQINSISRQLQQRQQDILARRSAAQRRYNQLRAQRAASLRGAGYGG